MSKQFWAGVIRAMIIIMLVVMLGFVVRGIIPDVLENTLVK